MAITPELRAKRSDNMKRRWEDSGARQKMLAMLERLKQSPESQAKKSASMKRLWQDPEMRARWAASNTRNNWRGDKAGYDAIHRRLGKVHGLCVDGCGRVATEWSFHPRDTTTLLIDTRTGVPRIYSTDLTVYFPRCHQCHCRLDAPKRSYNADAIAKQRRTWRAKATCRKGHPWTPETTRWHGPGKKWRRCTICDNDLQRAAYHAKKKRRTPTGERDARL